MRLCVFSLVVYAICSISLCATGDGVGLLTLDAVTGCWVLWLIRLGRKNRRLNSEIRDMSIWIAEGGRGGCGVGGCEGSLRAEDKSANPAIFDSSEHG